MTGVLTRREDRVTGRYCELGQGLECSKSKNAEGHVDHQRLEEARKDPLPEPSEVPGPRQHLDLRFLASRLGDKFLLFKPPSLGYFVTAALGAQAKTNQREARPSSPLPSHPHTIHHTWGGLMFY